METGNLNNALACFSQKQKVIEYSMSNTLYFHNLDKLISLSSCLLRTLAVARSAVGQSLALTQKIENHQGNCTEVFLCYVNPSLSESIHPCLGTHTLQLSARASVHFLRNLLEIDSPRKIHRSRVNPENIGTSFNTKTPMSITHPNR